MKKWFIIGIFSLLVLTGCKNEDIIHCTYTEDKLTVEYKGYVSNDKTISKVDLEYTFDTEKECKRFVKQEIKNKDVKNKLGITCKKKSILIKNYPILDRIKAYYSIYDPDAEIKTVTHDVTIEEFKNFFEKQYSAKCK